jgi:hypothetical protein
LRWSWAPEATGAIVVARFGQAPEGLSDPAAITIPLTRAEYVRQDCWVINLPNVAGNGAARGGSVDDGSWHLRVYSTVELDGGRSISAGLEPTAATIVPGASGEVTVSYVVRRPPIPGFKWAVTFRTEPAGAAIPPMVVVAHPRAVPTSAEDGSVVSHLPASSDGSRLLFRSRVGLSQQLVRLFPDPGVEPDGAIPIRLRHPENGTSRV